MRLFTGKQAQINLKINPRNKHASIGFSRLGDFGLPQDFDVKTLSSDMKERVLTSAFYTPCGMNDKGLTAALAYLPGVSTTDLKVKRRVFVTCWIREILDNAANVEEAIKVCKGLKAFDMNPDSLSHHILVSDALGNSVIVEFSDGNWRFIRENNPWQVATNSPLYNKSLEERKTCYRYSTAYDMLKKLKGKGTWKDGMNILEAISVNNSSTQTLWSFSADLARKIIYLCLFCDYSKVYKLEFPK